jgi:site-specific recombinase XerD
MSEETAANPESLSNQEIAAAFTQYMVLRNYSQTTQKNYAYNVADFIEYLGSVSILDVDDSKTLNFILTARKNGRSPYVANSYRPTLRTLYKFLIKAGMFHRFNPAMALEVAKLPRALPRFLTERQTEKLFSIEHSPRDRALLELAYASGLRCAELEHLNIEDLNLEGRTLRVRKGKGNKDRLALFGSKAADALHAYLGDRVSGPVFVNNFGNRLMRGLIYKAIRGAGKRAGLSLGPQMLRHSCATHLLNRGMDIRYVQQILGHVSIATTQIYTHIATDALSAVYAKCHPRRDERAKG